jgi:hypothetical protein
MTLLSHWIACKQVTDLRNISLLRPANTDISLNKPRTEHCDKLCYDVVLRGAVHTVLLRCSVRCSNISVFGDARGIHRHRYVRVSSESDVATERVDK